MVQLGLQLGAQEKTFYGLAGVGDIVLTAMGSRSKNLAMGRRIGKGEALDDIVQTVGCLPEGVNTLQSVYELIAQKNSAMPLCQAVYEVVFEKKSVSSILQI